MMGMLPANEPMVAKKSPKRTNMPYSSTRKPVNGQRRKINMMPAEKAAVPLTFSFLAKKTNVFRAPIIRVRPITNRIWQSQLPFLFDLSVPYIAHSQQRPIEEHQNTQRQKQAASCAEGHANL